MIEGITNENNKIVRKQNPILKSSYCKSCFSKTNKLCCKQVVPATTFERNVTLKSYQILRQLNCKISYIIYSLECFKFQIQYAGKSKNESNITLNNHRKDVTRKNSIPTYIYSIEILNQRVYGTQNPQQKHSEGQECKVQSNK